MSKQPMNAMSLQKYKETQKIPNPQKQYQGKQSRQNGAAFEDLITASCQWYKQLGTAEIDKTPEPMKILKSLGSGRFTACFLKKAQPDYKGTLQGGRAVVFEVKHTESDRIEQSRVTKEQTEILNRHYDMGAICFVLLSLGMQEFYRIPWTDWRSMKDMFGRKYIRPQDLQRLQISLNNQGFIMFLEGL